MSSTHKTTSGRVSEKKGGTLMATAERNYKINLGYRADTKLSTVLRKEGAISLAKLLEMAEKTKR